MSSAHFPKLFHKPCVPFAPPLRPLIVIVKGFSDFLRSGHRHLLRSAGSSIVRDVGSSSSATSSFRQSPVFAHFCAVTSRLGGNPLPGGPVFRDPSCLLPQAIMSRSVNLREHGIINVLIDRFWIRRPWSPMPRRREI